MSFDWPDYLELSTKLLQRSFDGIKDEALFRCVISRAYYSLLILGRNHCRNNNELIKEVHKDVANFFRFSHNPRERQIATDLDKLRVGREKADYRDLFDEDSQALAKNSVTWARRSIHTLKAL